MAPFSPSSPLYCMPLIIINMGGEMVYILEQRLEAQNVAVEKSKKVLQDVLRTMYSPKFIRELFKPQEMYSTTSTREIFNRLAHSSIMRLNESSMDKLHDLMTMGFKHQLQECAYPEQFLHVTINHLVCLKAIANSEPVSALIDVALQLAFDTYGHMSCGDWLLLRQSLYAFVHGRKIKVSLFLQNNFQNLDGSFALSNLKGFVGMGSEVPGKIRYYTNEEKLDYEGSFDAPMGIIAQPFHPDYHTPLGTNLYTKDIGKVIDMSLIKPPACAAADVATALLMQRMQYGDSSSSEDDAKSKEITGTEEAKEKESKSLATAGLNLLAELMGSANRDIGDEASEHGKPFRINLFPDDPFESSLNDGEGTEEKQGGIQTVILDATSQRKTAQRLMEDLNLIDEDEQHGRRADAKEGAKTLGNDEKDNGDIDDFEDLLDLMDSLK